MRTVSFFLDFSTLGKHKFNQIKMRTSMTWVLDTHLSKIINLNVENNNTHYNCRVGMRYAMKVIGCVIRSFHHHAFSTYYIIHIWYNTTLQLRLHQNKNIIILHNYSTKLENK